MFVCQSPRSFYPLTSGISGVSLAGKEAVTLFRIRLVIYLRVSIIVKTPYFVAYGACVELSAAARYSSANALGVAAWLMVHNKRLEPTTEHRQQSRGVCGPF